MNAADARTILTDRRSILRTERMALYAAVAFFVIMAVVAILTGGEEVWAAIKSLTLLQVAGLLGLSLINYAGRMLRWQLFSNRLGLGVPLARNCLYYVAGFALTATPAKAGEALRLWFLKRGHGIRYARSAIILVADRMSDMGGTVLLVAASVTMVGTYIELTILAVIGAVVMTALFLKPTWGMVIINFTYARVQRAPRLFGQLRHMLRQAAKLADIPTYGGALLLAVVGWFAEGFAFFWLLDILGADISLGAAVFIFSFSMIVGALAMLPGGLGGTEATMIGLLTAMGVELEITIAATAVIRGTTLWFAVLLGFIAMPVAMRMAGDTVEDTNAKDTE
ncbi:MAG: lysylphosphatidylglycerol synthase transmembrane domain-containing protein [Alphaproteobacteria bacterium]